MAEQVRIIIYSLRLGKLVIERDSANAVKWVMGVKRPLWKLITVLREIKALLISREISFSHVSKSANEVAYFFTKQGVDSAIRGVYHL